MRALIHSVLRHRRFLAALTVTLGFLLTPARADAQIWWDEPFGEQTFATFGPNQAVTIAAGVGPMAQCDNILPAINIYVVSVSSLSDGAHITDVSNAEGLPNTVFPFSGGFFEGETIAFTAPGGNLGPGTYGIVMKSCRDATFHAGSDMFLYPAFEVVIDANIPVLPDPSIAALKQRAHEQGQWFVRAWQNVEMLEWLERANMVLECVHGWHHPAGAAMCGIMWAYHINMMPIINKAHHTTDDAISHYGGIHADPPDPLFQQVTPLEPFEHLAENSDRPILNAMFRWSNTMGSEAAILQALLHSMERYQGAAGGSNPEWALVHARQLQSFAAALRNQLPSTNAALTAMNDAIQAHPADFDLLAAQWVTVHDRLVTTGFSALELQTLLNGGFSPGQINDLRNQIINDLPPVANLTKAAMQTLIAAQLAANAAFVGELSALESDMGNVIAALLTEPLVTNSHPIANAGGPYSGNEGTAVALDASASTDPGGAITAYAWDIDGDGQFDDATGATPTVTFASGFDRFVGLQVSDADGKTSVAYAYASIAQVNQAPTITAFTPVPAAASLTAGAMTSFTVTAIDADGDPVSVRWLVDGIEAGTGFTFDYTPVSLGQHVLRAEATDNNPAGGTVAHEWSVAVGPGDADGDGWNSTADCNDADASVHPGRPEIVGNGKDDDCNALTLDTGLPPVASFTTAAPLGVAGQALQFTDTSTDVDSAIVGWAWTFGDGGTSNEQNPSHAYAAAGNYAATLTVTDQHGNTDGVAAPVRIYASLTDAVTISFVVNELDCPDSWWGQAPAVYRFYIGNTLVGTRGSANGCAHNSTPMVFTLDDATDPDGSLRALAADEACLFLKIVTIGDGARVSYERVDIVRAGVPPTSVCVFDATAAAGWGGWGLSQCQARDTSSQPTTNGTQTHSNASDVDSDGTRDSCDTDLDGDGVNNDADNCPYVVNPGQELSGPNSGPGSAGDACRDTDADAVLDVTDNCPVDYNPNQANNDADAQGDVCDVDDDNDTVLDGADNCVFTPNTDQSNIDFDSQGDVCDQDMDGDGHVNWGDNCPVTVNPDQRNSDGDGQGDLCDTDDDNDTVLDAADNCPTVGNTDQGDSDVNGVGNVCETRVITVPWLGSEEQPHQVYSGGRLTLQGVAVTTAYLPGFITSATWDPGDGSPPQAIDFSNPLVLELQHTYTGAPGTPFTATLSATTVNGATISDTFKVVIMAKTLDVEANMAIDRGLWYLHKQMSFQQSVPAGVFPYRYFDSAGVAIGYQPDQSGPAATASMVQAMEINNHRESGNRLTDPYVDDVARGLAYITQHLFMQPIGMQPAGDPDTNGNGIGLYADGGSPIYVTGQLADALVASGTPNAIARTGDPTWVKGRTYKALVQDIMDMYWWGQADLVDGWGNPNPKRGGWRYNMNDQDSDSSTAQWAAIAGLAGRDVWGIPVPQFVYTQNLEGWIRHSQTFDGTGTGNDGRFGYENAGWVFSAGMADTPSGLVQMIFDGVDATATPATEDERRFQAALKYIARTWATSNTLHNEMNIYGMFALAKVMRLATPSPILTLGDPANGVADFDWYRNDPGTTCVTDPSWGGVTCSLNGPVGLARDLINNQTADGAFHAGNWLGTTLATDYAVIILSPTIFDLGPTAVCNVNPNVVAIGGTVNFDGSGSFHNNTDGLHSVTGWTWNFTDGDTASGATATHAFSALGTYHVQLTVTDNQGLTASTSCAVDVISGNLPPTVDIGGPYQFCAGGPMVLSTTATDPEAGPLTYAWDWTAPVNFAGAPDATTASANFSGGVGQYDVGVRVTDDNGLVTTRFTTIDVVPDTDASCVAPNTPPTVTAPDDIVTPASDAGGATVIFTATAVDAEDGPIDPVCSPLSGSTFPIGPTTVTCTVTDAGGLSATDTFTVTVTNNAPTVGVPADITTLATSAAGAAVMFTATGADVEDSVLTPACTPASGAIFAIGSTMVTCTVTDSHGASATDDFRVTVLNNPPSITVPGDITVPATTAAGAAVTFSATATDVEDGVLVPSCTPASGATFAIGPTTVICTVTDSHTISDSETFTVTVTNTAPTIAVPADQTLEATSSAGAIATFVVTGDDAEQGAIAPVCSAVSGATFPLGPTAVSCTVTDFAGLTASGSFTITVVDATAPAFAVSDVTLAATGGDGAAAAYAFTATDAVDGTVAVICVPASGATFPIGSTPVSCTATDAAGNSTTHGFNVIVSNTAPSISVPANMTIEATSAAGAAATFVVTGDDAEQGALAPACSAASGATFPLGPTTVSCTVTDFGGLTASGSFTITVVDTTAPAFGVTDLTLPATGPSGAVATYAFTAADVVDGNVAVICTPPSGSTFATGPTPVSCTATDAAGNSTTHGFTVTVTNAAPTIALPDNMTLEATSSAGAVATFVVTGDDAEQGALAPACSAASGATFPLGPTTVSCSVTDIGGLTASGSFTITVVDTTAPEFAVADLTLHATSESGAVATYAFTATDAVDGTVAVVCAAPSGTTFPIGTTTVNCSATDSAGNRAPRSFTVTVFNNAPICSAAGPSVALLWPPNHQWVPITLQGATDADGDALTITVTSIFQDEPVNGIADGDTAPDGSGIGTSTANVRAERAGSPRVPGDGRVYHISFAVSDGRGGVCTVPDARVGVPHDQSPQRGTPVDGGALFDSVTGVKKP